MSVDRALEILGLSGSPTKVEIRRAYLRKVKQHPPERDREGFVLVREAFDFLKDGVNQPPWPGGGPIIVSQPESEPLSQESFPQDELDHQFDLLDEALATDDPGAAARAMITLYSRPILEAGPIPPPLFCLQTFMLMIERGDFEPAHELLEAFEKHTALHRVASGFGTEVSARWRLARELQAICGIDRPLASAVARGLRTDNMGRAASQAHVAQDRGLDMPGLLAAQAPTIWSLLASLVAPPREEVSRPGWSSVGAWIGVIAAVLITLPRLCTPSWSSPSYKHTPSVLQASDRERDPAAQAPSTGPQLSFRVRAQRLADGRWSSLSAAIERGDCESVRAQWSLYCSAANDEVVDAATAAARKQQIFHRCPELEAVLEEKP